MYKLLSRKLMGENYRGAIKALIIAVIIGVSFAGMDMKIEIAQSVIILSSLFFSGTIIVQTLASADNARCLKGLFAMPTDERRTRWEYACAVGAYTLITKTSLLAALLIAFSKPDVLTAVLFLLGFIYALFGGMTAFAFFRTKPFISALFAAAGAAMAFLLPKGWIAAAVLAAADIAAAAVFSKVDTERFIILPSDSAKVHLRGGKSSGMLIPRYILRTFTQNKNYLFSAAVILGFSCFMAITTTKQGIGMGVFMGLALLSMNTPLTTVVSSNRGLKRKLDSLPDKERMFFLPYGGVVFCVNAFMGAVYLAVMFFAGSAVDIPLIVTALVFSAESAVFTAILEDRFTLEGWKTEPDLFHHPRKYIIPGLLILEAAGASALFR